MLALAYRDLPEIDAVEPLNDADFACLAALRDVLEQHGRLDRFGITLMHGHFPIHEHEVLVESCDDATRTLTMNIQPAEVLEQGSFVQTAWRLTDGAALATCRNACISNGGRHPRKHIVSR